jgi:hypothetical protein
LYKAGVGLGMLPNRQAYENFAILALATRECWCVGGDSLLWIKSAAMQASA